MDTSTSVEHTPKRQRRTPKEKREIVEATLLPGASVARVAREHGVNANQVFYWRRQYQQGQLGAAAQSGALVAVRVRPGPVPGGGRAAAKSGGLELELKRGWLRVENGADEHLLRIVLEHLAG